MDTIRLCEDEDLYAEITAAGGLDVASVTRRYSFTALLNGRQGHTWDCFVSVHGSIDPVTGMVTDIGALDRLVQEQVLRVLDRQDLREVLKAAPASGAHLAEFIWNALVFRLSSGALKNIRIVQSRDLSFDYNG